MALRRNRHDDLGGVQYQMREKVFSIGDDYWIETPDGERAFKVNGKADARLVGGDAGNRWRRPAAPRG